MMQFTTMLVSFVTALVLQNPAPLNAAVLPVTSTTTASTQIAADLALNSVNTVPTTNQPATVEDKVTAYFSDIPILVDIASCESNFRQTNPDGSLLHGVVDPSDIGVMQINQFFNGKSAKALGYDITTLQGNMAFARYLYGVEGTKPWASSEKCWSSLSAAQTEQARQGGELAAN